MLTIVKIPQLKPQRKAECKMRYIPNITQN